MNLTIKQMREIVAGAPEWATTYCTTYAAYGATFHWYGACKSCYELPVLSAAIADHDRTDHVSDIRNHIAPTTKVIEG